MKEINIFSLTGMFAENKDTAAKLRKEVIDIAIENGEKIIIDFKKVDSSTQSFIHALISNSFQKLGENALEIFEFKNCSHSVKTLIRAVINYSLE